jgi:DNA-binding CsgD family transcriptional regulator
LHVSARPEECGDGDTDHSHSEICFTEGEIAGFDDSGANLQTGEVGRTSNMHLCRTAVSSARPGGARQQLPRHHGYPAIGLASLTEGSPRAADGGASGARNVRVVLHGRDAERARLSALVQQAARGTAGALVVLGDAGTGKSALLGDTVDRARGVRVLSTQGMESEAPLAYAALHRLLRPVLGLVGSLPVPQARALEVAFGVQDGPQVEPFLVALATLGLLADAAEDAPLLCVVDDAHWLDPASAEALLFTARRVHADRVALLFAARRDDPGGFASEGIPSLELGGLDGAAARTLLAEISGGAVDDDVAERLTAGTGGNPLALLELPRTLTPEQLAGSTPLPPTLHLTEHVQQVFLDRCRRLPISVQTFVLVAAADDSARVATVRRAAELLGIPGEALRAAEEAGLIEVDGVTVRVRHPLVRTAIYQGATSDERRAVHAALAESLDGSGDADRRAWHRAGAADSPDGEVAAALEVTAVRAERGGAFAAAAAAYERATELMPTPSARAALAFAAARAAWAGGDVAHARAMAARARESSDDPGLLADVDRLVGRVEVSVGSAARAERMFSRAALAVAAHDLDRALEMAVAAQMLRTYDTDAAVGATGEPLPADLTSLADDDDPRTRCLKSLLAAAAARDPRTAVATLRVAVDASEQVHDPDVLGNVGNASLLLGHDQGLRRCYVRVLNDARDRGAATAILYALPRLAYAYLLGGEWLRLREAANEALDLSTSTGQRPLAAMPLAWLTLLAALQGSPEHDDLRARLDAASAQRLGVLTDPVHDLSLWAAGIQAGHDGDAAGAVHHLRGLRLTATRRIAMVDRVDAAVRAGDQKLARTWVREVADFAERTAWPWALGAARYGEAAVAGPDDAAASYESAIAHYRDAHRPYDLARTYLAYGELLRRAQRRVDARPHLRRALSHFDDLRAEPYRARAAQELRASGETARKRDPSTAFTLTPMELQVAQLVAEGLSNKAVAAQCWISPRTVAFHLRNCFAKTGVTTRGELARLQLA